MDDKCDIQIKLRKLFPSCGDVAPASGVLSPEHAHQKSSQGTALYAKRYQVVKAQIN